MNLASLTVMSLYFRFQAYRVVGITPNLRANSFARRPFFKRVMALLICSSVNRIRFNVATTIFFVLNKHLRVCGLSTF